MGHLFHLTVICAVLSLGTAPPPGSEGHGGHGGGHEGGGGGGWNRGGSPTNGGGHSDFGRGGGGGEFGRGNDRGFENRGAGNRGGGNGGSWNNGGRGDSFGRGGGGGGGDFGSRGGGGSVGRGAGSDGRGESFGRGGQGGSSGRDNDGRGFGRESGNHGREADMHGNGGGREGESHGNGGREINEFHGGGRDGDGRGPGNGNDRGPGNGGRGPGPGNGNDRGPGNGNDRGPGNGGRGPGNGNDRGPGNGNDHDHGGNGGGRGPGNGNGGPGNGGRGPGNGNGGPGNGGRGPGGGGGGGGHWRGNQRRFDDDAVNHMRTSWQSCRGGRCQENRNRQQRNRNAVRTAMMSNDRRRFDDATIQRRFQKTLEVKRALLQLHGLNDVEPHDNGLIGGDMLFSEKSLDIMSARLKGTSDPAATGDVPLVDPDQVLFVPLTGGPRQKRADMLALDYYSGNKWPSTTINFYINPANFKKAEADVIRGALKSISDVSCLKFVEANQKPVVEFLKAPKETDAGTCGWSDVGFQGDYNSININFDSTICKNTLQGVCVHEFLHALGFMHEHARYDRDRYMTIDWTNVDPQSLDVYDKDEPTDHNPYCAPFDPLSIMHYDAFVGAIDSSKPVIKPKTQESYYVPKMGQGNVMAKSDAMLLNRMYCTPPTCKDKSVNCGWTACSQCGTYGSVCGKSCGKC